MQASKKQEGSTTQGGPLNCNRHQVLFSHSKTGQGNTGNSQKKEKNHVVNHTPRPNNHAPNPHWNQHTDYRCKGKNESCEEDQSKGE